MAQPPRAGRRAASTPVPQQQQQQQSPSLPASLTNALGVDDGGGSIRTATASRNRSPVTAIPLSTPLQPDVGSFGGSFGAAPTPTPRQGRRGGASPHHHVSSSVGPPIPLAVSGVSLPEMSRRETPATGRSKVSAGGSSDAPSWLSDSDDADGGDGAEKKRGGDHDTTRVMTPSLGRHGDADSPEPFVSPQTHSVFSPTPKASPAGAGRHRSNREPPVFWNDDNDDNDAKDSGESEYEDIEVTDDEANDEVDELGAMFGDSTALAEKKTKIIRVKKLKTTTNKRKDGKERNDAMGSPTRTAMFMSGSGDEQTHRSSASAQANKQQQPPQPSVDDLQAELKALEAELAQYETSATAAETVAASSRADHERRLVIDRAEQATKKVEAAAVQSEQDGVLNSKIADINDKTDHEVNTMRVAVTTESTKRWDSLVDELKTDIEKAIVERDTMKETVGLIRGDEEEEDDDDDDDHVENGDGDDSKQDKAEYSTDDDHEMRPQESKTTPAPTPTSDVDQTVGATKERRNQRAKGMKKKQKTFRLKDLSPVALSLRTEAAQSVESKLEQTGQVCAAALLDARDAVMGRISEVFRHELSNVVAQQWESRVRERQSILAEHQATARERLQEMEASLLVFQQECRARHEQAMKDISAAIAERSGVLRKQMGDTVETLRHGIESIFEEQGREQQHSLDISLKNVLLRHAKEIKIMEESERQQLSSLDSQFGAQRKLLGDVREAERASLLRNKRRDFALQNLWHDAEKKKIISRKSSASSASEEQNYYQDWIPGSQCLDYDDDHDIGKQETVESILQIASRASLAALPNGGPLRQSLSGAADLLREVRCLLDTVVAANAEDIGAVTTDVTYEVANTTPAAANAPAVLLREEREAVIADLKRSVVLSSDELTLQRHKLKDRIATIDPAIQKIIEDLGETSRNASAAVRAIGTTSVKWQQEHQAMVSDYSWLACNKAFRFGRVSAAGAGEENSDSSSNDDDGSSKKVAGRTTVVSGSSRTTRRSSSNSAIPKHPNTPAAFLIECLCEPLNECAATAQELISKTAHHTATRNRTKGAIQKCEADVAAFEAQTVGEMGRVLDTVADILKECYALMDVSETVAIEAGKLSADRATMEHEAKTFRRQHAAFQQDSLAARREAEEALRRLEKARDELRAAESEQGALIREQAEMIHRGKKEREALVSKMQIHHHDPHRNPPRGNP